jgi:Ca-activated chloride channel family protein
MNLQLTSPSRSVSSSAHLDPLRPTTPEGASSGAELVTSDGRSLPLVGAALVGTARGGLARLVLEQRFVNPYDERLAVTYRMPLPADGAVSGYAFEIADRVIRGTIDRKVAARERFERAVASGHTAALLEQERADLFTQRIGNLPAGEVLIARITIDQRLVWLPEGEWELRFPTVIGPRYVGAAGSVEDVRATHVKVTDRPLAAGIQIAVTIGDAITGGARPSSPSHGLAKREDGAWELTSAARLDRDVVLRWAVAAREVGMTLDAMCTAGGDAAYGLLTVVPPVPAVRAAAVPRDLIVLLDTSGSMDGGPLDKAKQVVAMLIDSLGERDRLELIEFSNAPSRYLREPVEATPAARAAAIRWVRSRTAGGGTEMRSGVLEALATLRVGAQRQVVLVTDGYVGGEAQILEVLHARLPASCRLHVLGVGSAVNRSLATALARAGRGAEVIVGLDEDAERGARRLLDRTRAPMLTNVELAGSALIDCVPAALPDVFAGAPLVAALALRPEGGELVVRGRVADGDWEQRIRVRALAAGEGNAAIAALYGRERVADLEAREPLPGGGGVEMERQIEGIGLAFQIATRMTSWVAVDESRVTAGPERHEVVPQELPYGTSARAFGLRPAGGYARTMVLEEGVADGMPSSAYDDADADDFGEESSSAPLDIATLRQRAVQRERESEIDLLAAEPAAPAEIVDEPTGRMRTQAGVASPRAMEEMRKLMEAHQAKQEAQHAPDAKSTPDTTSTPDAPKDAPPKRPRLTSAVMWPPRDIVLPEPAPKPAESPVLAPAARMRWIWLLAILAVAAIVAALWWWLA